jgi:hypothetical protein
LDREVAYEFCPFTIAGVALQPLPERRGVDLKTFREEIAPTYRPCVLRGLGTDWPAVQAGSSSPEAFSGYLKRLDRGLEVEALVGPAAIGGRFFYGAGPTGFNFERRRMPISRTLDLLLSLRGDERPPAVYSGAVPAADHLPGFQAENPMALLDPSVRPRLWVGNAVSVAIHHDLSDNIACVLAGRRRFTLFPPEQVANLYIGPLDHTIAGQPVSMVALEDPDLERYPRFAEALTAAQTAELGPGDAIYIPSLWWHAVKASAPVNALANYWWNAQPQPGAPFHALIHGILGVSQLEPAQRRAWRAIFDHYVFRLDGDPAAHLAPEQRGVLGRQTPEVRQHIMAFLKGVLSRP